MSGGHFLSPWENPGTADGIPEGCWQLSRIVAAGYFKEYPLFSGMDLGFEEIVTPQIQLPGGDQ